MIANVLMACIILSITIIEDYEGKDLEPTIKMPNHPFQMKRGSTFIECVQGIEEIENQHGYYNMKNDLIDHL
jgi:hypothetical protein